MFYPKICALFGATTIILIAASCTVPTVTPMPAAEQMPAKYQTASNSDTMAVGLQPRAVFFQDPKLQAVIGDVLKGNPDIQVALRRISIAGAQLKMSKGALLPAISGLARASGTHYGKYTMEGVGNFDTNLSGNIEEEQKVNTNVTPDFWLGINASWELDLWGKLKQQKQAAQYKFWAAASGQQWMVSILVSQAATAYYELIALDKEAFILAENIKLQQKALEIVQAQKEAGRATALAVIQFEAQLLNTTSEQYNNKQRIAQLTNLLNRLAGRYEGTIIRSSEWLEQNIADTMYAGIPAQLLANRPDVKQASLHLAATHADAKAARAAFFPTINISAYTAFNAFNPNMVFSLASIGSQLLGGITAPLFQRYEIRSRFAIADAQQQQAFYDYRQMALTAYNEVIDELQEMKNNREILRLKSQQVTALNKGVAVANELYLNGYANYLEIITAQKSMLDAQLELINTQRKLALSSVALYKAAGGGWQ